jgi:hypothetical protein
VALGLGLSLLLPLSLHFPEKDEKERKRERRAAAAAAAAATHEQTEKGFKTKCASDRDIRSNKIPLDKQQLHFFPIFPTAA